VHINLVLVVIVAELPLLVLVCHITRISLRGLFTSTALMIPLF
jgi:hypothetical protein